MKGKKIKTAKMICELNDQVFNEYDEIFEKEVVSVFLDAIGKGKGIEHDWKVHIKGWEPK